MFTSPTRETLFFFSFFFFLGKWDVKNLWSSCKWVPFVPGHLWNCLNLIQRMGQSAMTAWDKRVYIVLVCRVVTCVNATIGVPPPSCSVTHTNTHARVTTVSKGKALNCVVWTEAATVSDESLKEILRNAEARVDQCRGSRRTVWTHLFNVDFVTDVRQYLPRLEKRHILGCSASRCFRIQCEPANRILIQLPVRIIGITQQTNYVAF